MRLCALCSFPVGEHPEDGLVHPWDCLNLDDVFAPQMEAVIDRHGNRVERPRRTHSVKCPDGSDNGATFEPVDITAAAVLPDRDPAGKVWLRGYQVTAMEPLRDGREEVRPTGQTCTRCDQELLTVIVDQADGMAAVRPMIGPTAQIVVAACPCGAAAAVTSLWGMLDYPAALERIVAELDGGLAQSENWPPPLPPEPEEPTD